MVVILEEIISGPFNYVEQNGCLKILIGCVWGNDGRGRGLVALQLLLTIKRAIPLSISNRMSPCRSFYGSSFYTKCPGLRQKKKKLKNKKLYQRRSLLRQCFAPPII